MLVPMAKVELIGPKDRLATVVGILHEIGTLHISDLSEKIDTGEVALDHVEPAEGAETAEDIEALYLRARTVLRALSLGGTQTDSDRVRRQRQMFSGLDGGEFLEAVRGILDPVEEQAASLAQSRAMIENEIALLERYAPILAKIRPLAQHTVTTGAYDSVALLVERRYKAALDALKIELHRITHGQSEIVSTDVDEDTTAAIVVFAKNHAEAVHHFLAMENVNQIRLPSAFQDMPFDEAHAELQQRRDRLPQDLAAVDAEIAALAEAQGALVQAAHNALADALDRLRAIPKFGRTEYAFLITGWVPVDRMQELRGRLTAEIGESVAVTQLRVENEDLADIPVAIRNTRFSAPYQTLLTMLGGGLPRYGTIDPTLMIAVFYPLFFGMIVGDWGYGLIMVAVVVWLRRKYRASNSMQMATAILGPAATSAVFFGLLFDEFLGFAPLKSWLGVSEAWAGPWIPFYREHHVNELMAIAIGIGLLQVLFGLVLGIINAVRTRSIGHAWTKGGLIGFVIGGVLTLAVTSFGFGSPVIGIIGAALLLIGLFVIIRFGKLMGVIEILEAIGNIMSYIRIMAVGLAGAIFAATANELMREMDYTIVGVLLAIVLQAFNFAVAAFSPNIHALRLNFLEFFSKFYEPARQEYQPFHRTGGDEG